MKSAALSLAALSLAFGACFVQPDAEIAAAVPDGGGAATVADGAVAPAPTQGGGGSAGDAAASVECLGYDANLAPKLATSTGTFLATGVGRRSTFSLDGAHWQNNEYVPDLADAAPGTGDIQATARGNGVLVAAASAGVMTSVDGLTWTERAVPETKPYVQYADGFSAVAFGKGVFVVSAGPRFSPLAFFHSTDGIDWPAPTVVSEDQCCRALNAIAFADDKFVAVGAARRTVVSDDGIAWRDDRTGSTDETFAYESVTFGNGVWVAVGSHSVLAWSQNGSDWNDASSVEIIGDFRNVVFDGTKFLTCARLACYSSPDGKTWTQAPGAISDPRPTVSLVYQGGVYVGLDAPATLMTSTDGLAWTPVFCGEAPALTSLAFVPR